jgi:hypothetical protein
MSLARIEERALVLSTRAAAGFFQESLLGRFIPGGLERLWPAFPLSPQAQSSDGGGGGGSGDGGGGSGDGGGGSGDGGNGGNGNGNGGGAGGNSTDGGSTASTDGPSSTSNSDAPSDAPAADPTTAPTEAPVTQNAVTPVDNNAQESPLDTIQDEATTDPRGGAPPSSFDNGGAPGATGSSVGPGAGGGAPPPAVPVDIAINAVIVSAATSPWGAVQRGPGVRNIAVTGGLIALGKTPFVGEPPPGSPQPAWLRVIPDPRLLDGSVMPPVVPNLIDIRWLNCPIEVIENPSN